MPLAVIHLPEGAIEPARLHGAVRRITDAFLEAQGAAPGSPGGRAIARIEIVEHRPSHVFLGGEVYVGRPLYRVEFMTPEGALDEPRRAKLVECVTEALLLAEGANDTDEANRHRVWCMIWPVPENHWACAGVLWNWRAIVRWVLRRDMALKRRGWDGRPETAPRLSLEDAVGLDQAVRRPVMAGE